MSKRKKILYGIIIGLLVLVHLYLVVAFISFIPLGRDLQEFDNPTLNTNTPLMHITFSSRQYTVGFANPSQQSDFISDSREWVTNGETVETWTTLLTTHRLTPTGIQPLSAEAYAQNVAHMLTENGAFMLELSVINQDMEALGIDPNNPPYLLVYLFEQNGMTEFNMQKIVQLNELEVGSIIYAERFPTKSEPEMQAYYDSPERTEKRKELISLQFPY